MKHIKRNIEKIKNNLRKDTTLVVVSKHRSVLEIEAVYKEGILDLGENRVQEFRDKEAQLPKDIRWHMIGHLQKNKVKYVVGKVFLIHSVDSLSLAKAIDVQSKKIDTVTKILLQINISGEESKQGVNPEEIENLLISLENLSNIQIKGLMTMAPDTKNMEQLADIFNNSKELYDRIKSSEGKYTNVSMEYLSMGMTNDYPVAVECGSNMVRIGSGIFKIEED